MALPLLPPFNQLQVHCINLDRRPDRWESAQAEWAKLGCPPENLHRVAAIDTHSYVGCAQSHQACVRMAQESALPYVCVVEDDVQFRASAPATYEALRSRVPDDCGILYGGVSFAGTAQAEFAPGLRNLGECAGLFCVVYFAAAYDTVLAWTQDNGNIDRYLGRQSNVRRVLSVPFLAGTSNGQSDLRKRITKDAVIIDGVEAQFLKADPDQARENVYVAESRAPRIMLSRAAYERRAGRAPAQPRNTQP